MSSTPGWLSSIDDFYINGQDLVVIETTNGLNNPDLYKLITPTGERTAALYLSRRDQTPQVVG